MTRAVWDPHAGMSPEPRPPLPAPPPQSPAVKSRTAHDGASFDAGRDCGTRVAACTARLAALELIDGARWWNRRGHRLMARAFVAYAEELESAADAAPAEASGRRAPFVPRLTGAKAVLRSV